MFKNLTLKKTAVIRPALSKKKTHKKLEVPFTSGNSHVKEVAQSVQK